MRGWLRDMVCGHRDVFGAILDVFGLGGGAGRVCAACVSQVVPPPVTCNLWCTSREEKVTHMTPCVMLLSQLSHSVSA
jgi:hypothetical protein